jgi:uncharacterized membrane protein YwaF
MVLKVITGIIAVLLLAGFAVPYLLKMKDLALGIVIVAGLGMMLWDLWESLQEKDE